MSWLKKHLASVVAALVVAIGPLNAVFSIGEKFGLSRQYTPTILVTSVVFATLIWTVGRYYARAVSWLRRLRKNLRLLFLEQESLHRRLKELQRAYSAGPFVQFAGLANYEGDYHIFFSHKGDWESHPEEGPDDDYRIPAFPYDEAEPVMRVWYPVAQHLHLKVDHVRPHCSGGWRAEVGNTDARSEHYKNQLLSGAFAIIGSSKHNYVCRELMSRLESMARENVLETRPPVLRLDQTNPADTICYVYLDEDHGILKPETTAGAVNEQALTDYALLMRLPNILSNSGNGTILVLAGCKVAGQVGLTEWIADPTNLIELDRQFPNGKACCAVFEVNYFFRPKRMPRIRETKILPGFPRVITLKG